MYEKFLNYFTDYIFVKDEPQKADVIFVPGNGYPQMAAHAAELWKEGFAPYVLPSGRYSTVLGHFAGVQDLAEQYGGNYETEWEFLRTVLHKNGVPEKAILREDKATYTYENALRSREVTDAAGIHIECGDAQAGIAFGQMRGLATGGGAGIQHPAAGCGCQRISNGLCGSVLYRYQSCIKAR